MINFVHFQRCDSNEHRHKYKWITALPPDVKRLSQNIWDMSTSIFHGWHHLDWESSIRDVVLWRGIMFMFYLSSNKKLKPSRSEKLRKIHTSMMRTP